MPYTAALHASNQANASIYGTIRSNAPKYGDIAEAGIEAEAYARKSAIDAGKMVATASINAMDDVHQAANKANTKIKLQEMQNEYKKSVNSQRKAGRVSAAASQALGLGVYAAGGGFKKRKRTLPSDGIDYSDRIAELTERSARLRTEEEGIRSGIGADKEKPDAPTVGDKPNTSGSRFTSDHRAGMDIVAKYESGPWGYDAMNQGGSDGGHTAHGSGAGTKILGSPLTGMSIGQLKKLGAEGKIHATGRYQFTHNTGSFGEAATMAGLKDTDLFSEANQDLMFQKFHKAHGNSRWIGLKNASSDELAILDKSRNTALLDITSGSPAGVEGGAFKPIEYLSGDPNHKSSYRADHGGSNYHEHLAFGTTAERDRAMAKLKAHGIKIGSVNDGKHAEGSYHYSDRAFDVPGTNWEVGAEAAGSKRVREILGLE